MKRWWWPLALSFLPVIAGGLIWLVYFRLGWLPDYVVYSRVSLGILVFAAGVGLSLIFVVVVAIAWSRAIRAEKRINDERSAAGAAHRQFILRLDHELKNPLTSLQVELANLEAMTPTADENPSEKSQTIHRLHEQTNRLRDLVLQLRKVAELDRQTIESDEVNLDQLLTDLVTEFRLTPAGMARKITLDLPQVPWPLPNVWGDADLLYLALHNVLGNAVKFTRPGDSIQTRAYEDANHVIVEIADTGPGIPEEEQAHVWKELFRGKMARGTPGSGLGLALVKAIIERHDGQVTLRSRVNRGTIVTIRIPTQT